MAALAFAYCYLELALCCIVQIKNAESASPYAWLLLILASLPFVAMPAFFGWNFDKRYAIPAADSETSVTLRKEQSLKALNGPDEVKINGYKDWLENDDLEMVNTERKLINEGENAPIQI